jgi:hypothetical protein
MIAVDLIGGLGNQLFQIFCCIALGMENNTEFQLPINKRSYHGLNGCKRPVYWDSLLKKLTPYTTNKNSISHIFNEQHHGYTPFSPNIKNITLYGYFQSYKYFDKYFDTICNMIGIEELKNSIKLDKKDCITVSMHFRIGDYVVAEHCHPVIAIQYYINSIRTILDKIGDKKILIFYFCEDVDLHTVGKHIITLKNIYPTIEFCRYKSNDEWNEMLTMSICDHNIIANSTFSLWGAYFNLKNDKIVCYPDKWFGPQLLSKKTDDMFYDSWLKINTN